MIYSSGYPVIHKFIVENTDAIDYSILFNNEIIYIGRLIPYNPALGELEIDISVICREYLNTYYENVQLANVLHTNISNTIGTFTVKSDSNPETDEEGNIGADMYYTIGYNYNTDYIQPLEDAACINYPISTLVDERQRINFCGYNINGINTFSINGVNSSLNSQLYQVYTLNLDTSDYTDGDSIRVINNGTTIDYKVVSKCKNRFVLHYVNKYGGLDSLLCSGKSVESTNSSRTDIRLYNDRLNRRDWEQKRIFQDIDKRYELNTGMLTDEEASRIDNLINSPKVWLEDLDKGTITSCLIESNNYNIKKFRNDRVVQYTINVYESQKAIRI